MVASQSLFFSFLFFYRCGGCDDDDDDDVDEVKEGNMCF